MANRHQVTVHIWANTPAFEQWLGGPRRATRPDNFVAGHAALKLQAINADKGDYYYLSMLPNHEEVHIKGNKYDKRKAHTLAVRYGTNSKSQALLHPVEEQKLFETSNLDSVDKEIFKGSAKTTYRFNGPNLANMTDFITKLANSAQLWDMYNYNCAQAVADCLKAGGASDPPAYGNFTPNRVAEWCEALCKKYPGSEIKRDGKLELAVLRQKGG